MDQKLDLVYEWNTVLIKYWKIFVSADIKVLINTTKIYEVHKGT